MKRVIIVFIGILIISCNQNEKNDSDSEKQQSEIEKEPNNFDWLLGEWKRLEEEEGKQTFESWTKNSEIEYSGIGFTMQHGDTIKQERIRLIENDGNWNLVVKTPDETKVFYSKWLNNRKADLLA